MKVFGILSIVCLPIRASNSPKYTYDSYRGIDSYRDKVPGRDTTRVAARRGPKKPRAKRIRVDMSKSIRRPEKTRVSKPGTQSEYSIEDCEYTTRVSVNTTLRVF